MRFLKAAAAEVIGLFVGDWTQTVVSVVILAAGWLVLGRIRQSGLGFIVALALAIQLVFATTLEARRRA
jgi:hypothetical protein